MRWRGTAILLLFCAELLSQEQILLEGKIVDSLMIPLADINVNLLYAQDSGLVKTELTNDQGRYSFGQLTPGKYLIHAQGLGFESQIFAVDLSLSGDHLVAAPTILKSRSHDLNEIAIVSRKNFIERQADKLVMNVENSIHGAGNSALELLQKAPGVLVNQDQSIALSGKQGVIILIDGRKTQVSGLELMNYLRTIQASNISKIEINSNPSSKYDAEGNAGIIDIRLKKDIREGLNGNTNISLGQGKYFKPSLGANANFRKNKINLFGNYSISKPDNFTNFYINRQFFNQTREVSAIFDQSSVIKQDFLAQTLKLGADYYFHPKFILGAFAYLNLSYNIRHGNSNSIVSNPEHLVQYNTKTNQYSADNKTNVLLNFNLKKSYDKQNKDLGFDLDFGNYNLSTQQDFNNQFLDPQGVLFDSFYLNSNQKGNINVFSAKVDYSQFFYKIKLETGLKSSLVKTENDLRFFKLINNSPNFDTSRSSAFSYHENINAGYLILSTEHKNLEYQLGLRIEQTFSEGSESAMEQKFSRQSIHAFPSLMIHFKKWKTNDFAFSYSRRIDRPTFRQLQPFKIYVDPYTYVVGDPKLLPSLTHSFEFTNTLKGKYITTLNYSVSNNIITDVFTQDDSSKISFQSPANIEESRSYSITMSLAFQKLKWLNSNLDISGFYSDYSGLLAGNPITNKSYSWYTNVQNNILLNRNWSGEISFFYQSKMAWGQFTILDLSQLNIGIQKQSKDKLSTYKFAISDIFHNNKIRVLVDHDNQKFHTDRNWDSTVATFSYTYRFGKSGVQKARQRQSGMEDEKRRAG